MPHWLHVLSIISLASAGACALGIVIDLLLHPQQMWIMNIVWPVNALYWGPFGLWAYYSWGRLNSRSAVAKSRALGEEAPGKRKPFWAMVAVGDSHCGAGCTLGDIIAEWTIFGLGLSLFGAMQHYELFTAYVLDFAFAYALGIVFQYFTIAPMRGLGFWQGFWAAIKADTLSLTAFEIGLFGWMALPPLLFFGHPIDKSSPVFWFMMQIGMILGFFTSYPVNWWLLSKGLKEKM